MELTYDDIRKKLKKMGFNIGSETGNGNLLQIEIQKYSPAGQDCNFILECEKGNPASAASALRMVYDYYDVDTETKLWIGEDGHGTRGAPYHIKDILKDMEAVEEDLEKCADELEEFVDNFEIEYSKEDIQRLFAERLCHINGEENIQKNLAILLCKQTVESILNENKGSPEQKKDVLDEYLLEIGITSDDPEACFKALDKVQKQTLKNIKNEKLVSQCRNKNLHTVLPMMSSTEVKVHRMFDNLFNDSETNPVDYAHAVLHAGPDGISKKKLNENDWWKSSCIHAVNSGGELWQSTYERIQLMEKYGLIKNTFENPELYGPCYETYKSYMQRYGTKNDVVNFTDFVENIFPYKTDMIEYMQIDEKNLVAYKNYLEDKSDFLVDKYNEKADKMWGEYMHMYLKNLDVLPYEQKEKLWDKNNERMAVRSDSFSR